MFENGSRLAHAVARILPGSMRFVLFLLFAINAWGATPPPDLATALQTFRPDPPPGWSFTQTTVADGKSTVERCNAAKPEFDRWTLIRVDGRAPSEEELARYAENRSRRSRTGTAPKITDQLDLATIEVVTDTAEVTVYRCKLRPGESSDKTAQHLRATLTLHKPTRTIESLALSSVGEFSPTLGVKVTELRTVMNYTRATDDAPPLPQKVSTRQRGTAFWFKILDAEMTVTFSDYERVAKAVLTKP